MLTPILRGEAYQLLAAADGQEAVDRLQSPAPPGLVLLDLKLPLVDGFRVRQMEDPVIVSSAACFLKPVDMGQLLELVRSRVPLSHASARGEWEDEEYRSR